MKSRNFGTRSNFEARAEGIPADAILDDVLEAVPVN